MSDLCVMIETPTKERGKPKTMKTFLVSIQTQTGMYGKTVKGYDAVLELVTKPETISYIVTKDGEQVTFAHLASAWRHPARAGRYPMLMPPQ